VRLVLRIKRVHFDAIASEVKSVEYREFRPFYARRLINRHFNEIEFHYQRPPRLRCRLVGVRLVRNPYPPERRPHGLTTDWVFALTLANPRLI